MKSYMKGTDVAELISMLQILIDGKWVPFGVKE